MNTVIKIINVAMIIIKGCGHTALGNGPLVIMFYDAIQQLNAILE